MKSIITFLFMVFSAFTASAESYLSAGGYSTNPSISSCNGTCNVNIDNANDGIVTFGHYFKTPIVDVGAEISTGQGDIILINLRKRFKKWSAEIGAGRYRQEFDLSFANPVPAGESEVVTGREGSGDVYHIGLSRNFGKNSTIFGRFMHSEIDLNVVRSFFKNSPSGPVKTGQETSRLDLNNNTIWVGYRFNF